MGYQTFLKIRDIPVEMFSFDDVPPDSIHILQRHQYVNENMKIHHNLPAN